MKREAQQLGKDLSLRQGKLNQSKSKVERLKAELEAVLVGSRHLGYKETLEEMVTKCLHRSLGFKAFSKYDEDVS
ncbi:hypothetical protein ACH5RR_012477 [Cinchona calisaya]|uniref:Uncharacterized protein n=1 Tax=Cinchona calisaya TaxID=153742 RepID=A0ABD3A7S1_9GENT